MAEPARQPYDKDNEKPVTRPELRVLEGGGQTSEPKKGHLKEAGGKAENSEAAGDSKPEVSASELKSKEEAPEENSPPPEGQIGGGYKQAVKNNSWKARLTGRRAVVGFGALGTALIIAAIGLFSFLNVFKLDGLMSNIQARAFLRSTAVLDGRSSKWVSAYIQARMLDMGDNADLSKNENILFRSNRVDTNSPFTDWYKTLRASKFEQDVFEKQGIKFVSVVTADGKIRPGRIDINNQKGIPITISNADFNKLADGDIATINKFQSYVDTEVFKNNKAARKEIKRVVNDRTLWYQLYKRRQLRKSIQNMTGVTDWRFFEKTRDKARENSFAVRNKIIDKMVPDENLLGRVTRCFFGLEICNPSRDVADPKNKAIRQGNYGADKTKTDEEIKQEQEFLDKLGDKGINPGDMSEALRKILTRANLITNLIFLPDTLDMITAAHNNISGGGLVKLIVLARGAQATGLYQEFTTASDQLKTGEVTGEEVNQLMQIISTAGSSDGWAKVVGGKGDPSTASSTGSCSREELARAEKYPNQYQKKYAPLCADERIGSASKAKQIQDDYNATVGPLVGPIAGAWSAAKGNIITGTIIKAVQWFGGLISSALNSFLGAVLNILGLKDNVEKAIFWIFGKLSAFLGINILSGNESGGKYFNWLVQGGAYTAESDARQKGASLTNDASRASAYLAVKQYQSDKFQAMSLKDRVASLDNPDSLAYKGMMALSNFKSDPRPPDIATAFASLWRGLGAGLSAIFSGRSDAASVDGYAASKFAGIETYDFPPKCSTLDPILSKPIDGTNALDVFANPSKYGLANAPISVAPDQIDALNSWEVETNGDLFYETIYGIIGVDTVGGDDIAVQIYNCNLLDTAIRGSLGYLYGYTKDNGLEDNSAGSAGEPVPGGGTVNPNDLYKDSTNIACDPRTRDLGIQDGYSEGKLIKIRICSLPNLPGTGAESNGGFGVPDAGGKAVVNSRVSGTFYDMIEAMKSAGINTRAGSAFRTMANQESLWELYGRDTNRVARPGYSNHQMGIAIDFGDIYDDRGGQIGPCNPKQSSSIATYRWLEQNAAKYGIKQYCAEAWHWSPSGN